MRPKTSQPPRPNTKKAKEKPPEFDYIRTGAIMRCSLGSKPASFSPIPKTVMMDGEIMGSTIDKIPPVNGFNFGRCSATKKGCASCIALTNWQGVKDDIVLVNQPALLINSTMPCAVGGTIKFLTSGQG